MKFLFLALFMPIVCLAKDCRVVKLVISCRENGVCLVLMNDNFETLALDPTVGAKMCKTASMPYYVVVD